MDIETSKGPKEPEKYDFSQFIRDPDGKVRSNRKLNNNNYGKMGDETWYDYLQNNKESMIQSDYAPVNEGNADFGFVARNDNGYAPLSRKDKIKNYKAALSSVKHKLEGKDSVQVEEAIESSPEKAQEIASSDLPEPIKEEAEQRLDDNPNNNEVNNAKIEEGIKELPVRKTIPGSEPDPLGINISNEDKANWNNGKDRAVGDATLSEMNNALASRTRSVKPGTEMLDKAKPKGMLGAGMLYSRDNNIPKPSEEAPIDASKLEQIIETNPEAVKAATPVDNPIHTEAEQVTDGDARTTEANNAKVEEGIKQGGIDWDKLEKNWYEERENLNKPQENLKDEFGQPVSDFSPEENEVINEALSEDFNTVDDLYNYLEDVYDPGIEDQNQYQEAVDNVPDPDETIYDESMASQPVIPEEKLEPAPEAPYADNVAQIKEDEVDQLQEDIAPETVQQKPNKVPDVLNEVPAVTNGSGISGGSSISSSSVRIPGSSFGPAFSGGRPFTFGSVPSGSVSAPSVASSKTPEVTYKAEHTKLAGGGVIPEAKQGTSSNPIGGSKSSGNVISNGATYSGGTNKSSRSLKYVSSANVLPHGEDRMESYDVEGQAGGVSSGNEATLNNIESRVKSIQPWSLAEQLGFSAKYKHVAYNGTSIDQLSPEQIREVLKILDILGV